GFPHVWISYDIYKTCFMCHNIIFIIIKKPLFSEWLFQLLFVKNINPIGCFSATNVQWILLFTT
ncbi:hypothetical protein, partial [Flavobacterium bomense]|uniref:hypothetical protein n=1 Tax=Flavobacterium bomense TaxID=2497483 RepID=UPI001F424D22